MTRINGVALGHVPQYDEMTLSKIVLIAIVVANGVAGALDSSGKSDGKSVRWTGGSFEWPCPATRSIFKNSGRYVSKNVIATRVAIFKDDAILALPRLKAGVPATLARLSLKDKNCQARLVPYPCWSLQEEGTCDALQNVVDVFLDPQDILWVLDTGVVDSLQDPVRRCPPKVVAFNVKTGKLVKSVDLSGLTSGSSRLQYLVADYSPDGRRAFVYVSDGASGAILIYDASSGRGYRIVLPRAVTLGCSRRDVLYLDLLRRSDGTSCLLFTYLCGSRLFSIRTDRLRGDAGGSSTTDGEIRDLGPKPRRLVLLGTDNGAALFFRFEGEAEIYRWDSNEPFLSKNFQRVYASDACSLPIHVVADYKRGAMRVLESNFPDYVQGTVGCGVDHVLSVM